MIIFEVDYTNLKTGETKTKTIDFTLTPSLNYRETFEYALNRAFEMRNEDEEVTEIRNISY